MPYIISDDVQDAVPAGRSGYIISDGPPLASDPTEGMSVLDKLSAGFGKALTDMVLGGQQITAQVGSHVPGVKAQAQRWLTDLQAEAAEKRQLDAALMNTKAGLAGDIAGQVVPTFAVPIGGAATGLGRIALAAGVGGAQGALQPTTEDQSRALNTALGAGVGALGQGVANGIGAMVTGAKAATPAIEAAQQFADANDGVLTRGQISGSPFTQRLEKLLASLPGAGGFYRGAADANTQATASAIEALTGGNAGALIQRAGAGRSLVVDQPLVDELQAIRQQFASLADRDAPNSALKTIEQMIGTRTPNPALANLPAPIRESAIAQGVPEFVGGAQAKLSVGNTLPMVGERGDFNNYQALRSLYGQRANSAGDAADKAAYGAIRDAFDNAAMRSLAAQGADPATLQSARHAYAVEKIVQPARVVDPVNGDVTYDPGRIAALVAATDRAQSGMIDRLGDAGKALRQLANFAQTAQPLKSSGTAEGNIAGSLASGALIGDALSGGGLHHLGAALAGLYATPRIVNTALQATRNGIPVLRDTPDALALALRQAASTLPAAGTLTLGDLLPGAQGEKP